MDEIIICAKCDEPADYLTGQRILILANEDEGWDEEEAVVIEDGPDDKGMLGVENQHGVFEVHVDYVRCYCRAENERHPYGLCRG
jgi:hypothetical protein